MILEFDEGVTRFINHAKTLDDFLTSRLIRCPCVNCENVRYHTIETWYCGSSIYGYPEKAYQKKSWYYGSSSSSFDGGDKEAISAMETCCCSLKREEKDMKRGEEIAAAKEVENKRYAALQAQLTFLFESGNILPPCPASSDENDKSDKESEGDENDTSDKESESD
ncbi:hypothetical protein H5410_001728 [Solanum commersonii]|uniref:Transposase-associated domain-containing protein n=1 Tax=Solanum commersonii TaxID=4109 RepID=A0A9J6B0E8_SOLCO|nr:hypothetical protein H5410_001728 [Solanum commersonii]